METHNNKEKEIKKLTDQAFSRLMLTSLLGMLVCIACLCSATWAWYNASISSNTNELGAGVFGLTVSYAQSDEPAVELSVNEDGTSSYTFAEVGTYKVTLTATDSTTVSRGFCILKADGTRYYTDAISADSPEPYVFNLVITEENTTVVFAPSWGLPANVSIVDGTITIQ